MNKSWRPHANQRARAKSSTPYYSNDNSHKFVFRHQHRRTNRSRACRTPPASIVRFHGTLVSACKQYFNILICFACVKQHKLVHYRHRYRRTMLLVKAPVEFVREMLQRLAVSAQQPTTLRRSRLLRRGPNVATYQVRDLSTTSQRNVVGNLCLFAVFRDFSQTNASKVHCNHAGANNFRS